MRLLVVRHGETIENITGVIQGQLPGTLSKTGIQQAKMLAFTLKSEKIDYIYSSDLARAVGTTTEIAKYHPHLSIHYVNELRERNLGVAQGKKKSEIWGNRYNLEKSKFIFLTPGNGESLSQLHLRAKNFFDQLYNRHLHDTILIVGHNLINLSLILAICNRPIKDIANVDSLTNTSITIIEIDERRNYNLHLFNCTSHLSEAS